MMNAQSGSVRDVTEDGPLKDDASVETLGDEPG